jgi:RHS repeat-associated protein
MTMPTGRAPERSSWKALNCPAARDARSSGNIKKPAPLTGKLFDAVGNRLNHVVTSGTTTTRVASYGSTNNRITGMTENAAALRTYTYDGNGNILTDTRPGEVFAFTYNKRNRPVSVTRNSVAYASYGYNANQQLVSRSTSAVGGPSGIVHYIYDLQGHVIAEADGATGATTREYIWLAPATGLDPVDLPIGLVSSGTLYMVHTDHLARPIRVTNATKATVWSASYTSFGEPQAISGTLALDLRFPGQLFQIETGLSYNWHRHYDPVTGRYTQADPLRFVDGPSVYAYVRSSPYMYVDPTGKVKVSIGVYGEITPGLGFGSSLGVELDFPWFGDDTPIDLKFHGSLSGRMGLASSGGIVVDHLDDTFESADASCGCAEQANPFSGQLEGDLSGYIGPFGGSITTPVTRGPDGTLDFGTGSGDLDAELVKPTIRFKLGEGVGFSTGLGASGSISIRGVMCYIKNVIY